MNFRKRSFLFTLFGIYLSLQGVYGSEQSEKDQEKTYHSYYKPPNSNSNPKEHESEKFNIKHDLDRFKEPMNAFAVIETIRQKKGRMGYSANDVEEGLTLLSSFISSGEELAKNEKDSLNKRIYNLERDLDFEKVQCERLIKEKSVIQKEKDEFSRKINDLERKFDQQTILFNQVDAELKNAKKDLEYLNNESQRVNRDHRESQQDLKDEIKSLYNQLKEKSESLNKNQKELNDVHYKISALEKEKEQLLLDLKAQRKETESLQLSNKNLQEMYFNIENEHTKLGQENILLSNQLRYIQNDLEEKKKLIQRGTNYVSELDKEKLRLEEKTKQKGFQLETAEDKLHLYQDSIKQKDEDLLKKDESIRSLKEEIEKKQERINMLERENTFKDQIPLLRGNLITILTLLGKPSSSDNLMVLSSELMQAVILKISQANK